MINTLKCSCFLESKKELGTLLVDGVTRGRMLVNWGIAEGEKFNLPWNQAPKRKMWRKLSYKSVRLVFVV